jgi:transposase
VEHRRPFEPACSTIRQRFELLTGIPGIAQIGALQLLGELALLSPEMSARQWVAHSGLDPARQQSGTSIHKPSRISRAGNRNLRRVLSMPAPVAIQHDPHLKAFYRNPVARHKAKMQALIAVARKLLRAIYGIFKSNTPYNGAKLFPKLAPQ